MARDKLITIRIEGEKREAFNQLAKSQNTDTASLLYDFISGCLDGRIDIKLVTGKGNRLDKLDNRIDSDRIDKLETDTQRLDHWIGALSERLNDWILRSDRRLTDCEKELSNKIISLEHRLNALAMQLDSQEIDSEIDSIDTDSQQDRQGENPDMGTVATVETAIDKVEAVYTVETADTVESVDTVESANKFESVDEPDNGAIGPVRGDSPQPKNQLSEAVTIGNRQGLTNQQLHEKTRVPVSTIEKWKGKIKEGEKVKSTKYPDFFKQWSLNLDDSLWYEVD